jgi:hypothetical protein
VSNIEGLGEEIELVIKFSLSLIKIDAWWCFLFKLDSGSGSYEGGNGSDLHGFLYKPKIRVLNTVTPRLVVIFITSIHPIDADMFDDYDLTYLK